MDIDALREHLTGKGLAAKTIRLYLRQVERAEEACGPLDRVSAVILAGYAEGLPAGYSTRRHLASALAAYWEMAGVEGPVRAIRIPRKPRGRCRALSEDDAAGMVKVAVGWHPEGTAALFGFYLALRTAETASAHMGRFDEDLAWYTVTGKGDVTAALPVHPILADQVTGLGGWVFPGRERQHVTAQCVWNWIRKVAARAGVDERVWPHRLRHTALATANDNTGDLRSVMTFARHQDPTSTLIYTRTLDTSLRRVSDALDYLP